jgi:haloalkane dehalogenase
MRVFPKEIVRGRAYLREVEAGLTRITNKPAIILWPDGDPGFGDPELARWQSLFPRARTVVLPHTGQFIDEDAPEDIISALEAWRRSGMAGQV